MSNFNKIADGMYICNNQNGFKRAVDDYLDDDYIELRRRMYDGNYPTTGYPCLVSLSLGYRGYVYIQVNCIRVDELLNKVQKKPKFIYIKKLFNQIKNKILRA